MNLSNIETFLCAVRHQSLSVAASALFISHITVGGGFMDASVFPSEVADIISGVVIYLCAFSMIFKMGIAKIFKGKPKATTGKEGDR